MSEGADWSALAPQVSSLLSGLTPFIALIGGVFLALGLGAFLFRWFAPSRSRAEVKGGVAVGRVFVPESGLPSGAMRGYGAHSKDVRRAVSQAVARRTAERSEERSSAEEVSR